MEENEKSELISIIGQLNSEIFDLKQKDEPKNSNNSKNIKNFVNSPMMSSSAVEFIETERNAMSEAYEADIQSLKRELQIEKDTSKNTIQSLQEKIDIISSKNEETQNELEKANSQILDLQKLLEEQRSLNLVYKSLSSNRESQDALDNSEMLLKFEKVLKENEELKEEVDNLSKSNRFNEEELQKQIEKNNSDREKFLAEVKRLTENPLIKVDYESSNSHQDLENEKERLATENLQLRSNLAHMASALKKATIQNTRTLNDFDYVEFQSKVEECAQYKAAFASLQALFNTDNKKEIISEVNRLYQNAKRSVDYEHMQKLLKDEMKKNEELRLMVYMGAKVQSEEKRQTPPSSPHFEDHQSNDAFLLQERLSQVEAEKEDLARTVHKINENCETLRTELSQKDQIIEDKLQTIKNLQDEADKLRGEILSHEEQLSIKNESSNQDSNKANNEAEMKELLSLIESLREENDELRLTIGRKESESSTVSQNPTPTPSQNQNSDQELEYQNKLLQFQLSQIQQKVLHIANALRQRVEIPTPSFNSFTEFLDEKVITPPCEESEISSFAEEAINIASQLNTDYRTLNLVQDQCVSAYLQISRFFGDLKNISDKVENFYCGFDAIYEKVCGYFNYGQGNFFGADENLNDDDNFELNMNQKTTSTPIDDGNMMQGFQKPTHGNASFVSLLDSPKIYRNELLDQNSDDEVKMNLDDLDEIPSLSIKSSAGKQFSQIRKQSSIASSSSSKIPKAAGTKGSKSRIPLASRQNAFDQRMLSPKQAPSHIPELPSKRKNKF